MDLRHGDDYGIMLWLAYPWNDKAKRTNPGGCRCSTQSRVRDVSSASSVTIDGCELCEMMRSASEAVVSLLGATGGVAAPLRGLKLSLLGAENRQRGRCARAWYFSLRIWRSLCFDEVVADQVKI